MSPLKLRTFHISQNYRNVSAVTATLLDSPRTHLSACLALTAVGAAVGAVLFRDAEAGGLRIAAVGLCALLALAARPFWRTGWGAALAWAPWLLLAFSGQFGAGAAFAAPAAAVALGRGALASSLLAALALGLGLVTPGWAEPGPEGALGGALAAAFALGVLLAARLRPPVGSAAPPSVPAAAPSAPAVAELAHELRTPLHQILGFAEIIEERLLGPAEETYREYAGLIRVSGRNLLELTEGWLEHARLSAGKRELYKERFDLSELLAEAARGFAPLAGVKSLRIEREEAGPVPVLADRRAWRQIATNLLANAVKFSPEGGLVRLRVRRLGSAALLEVEDSGPGVALSERPKLTRPFFRTAAAGGVEGTGLGLSIVRGLIELHQGGLEIGDSPLGGALFRASAPVFDESAPLGLDDGEPGGEITRLDQHT